MLRPEGEHDRILVGGRLKLEVERAAELLAEREAPRAIDPAAERRVEHELHAAGLVEEPLEDKRLLSRHDAEDLPRGAQVCLDLRRRFGRNADRFDQPAARYATA